VLVTVGDVAHNHAPTGTFAVDSSSSGPDHSVQFTATVQDPDNDRIKVTWDFGDGTTEANTLTLTHSYFPNNYFVRLTLHDGRGGISAYEIVISVLST